LKQKDVNYPAGFAGERWTAYLPHRVAIAIVGGFLILFFLLRFIRFFAFLLPLVAIVALLALITILVFLLYVHFYLSLSLLFLFFWLLDIGSDGKRFRLALWVQRDIGMDDVPGHWTIACD